MTSTRIASTLHVGEPDVAGPLAVFPVFAADAARLEYRSYAEAAALGARVSELEPATVNDLLVDNPLGTGLLLYEGEELQGAQQDRTLDVSVLVPAGARLKVPVSCVEAHRWDGSRRDEAFAPAPQTAYPRLRRAKARAARSRGGRADQTEVWASVAGRVEELAVFSATGAMRDVYDGRRGELDALRAAVGRRDGQVGAVAAIGSGLCVADVVGRADVFAALHGPLVNGYALDALGAGREEAAAPPTVAEVETFLAAALGAAGACGPGVGAGRLTRFASAQAEGSRLEHEGELVALTAFPGEQPRARLGRPSRRRR